MSGFGRSASLALLVCACLIGESQAQVVAKRWEDMTPSERQAFQEGLKRQNARVARSEKCRQLRIIATMALAYRNGGATYEYAYSSIIDSASGPTEALRETSDDGGPASEKVVGGAYNWKGEGNYAQFVHQRCLKIEPFSLF